MGVGTCFCIVWVSNFEVSSSNIPCKSVQFLCCLDIMLQSTYWFVCPSFQALQVLQIAAMTKWFFWHLSFADKMHRAASQSCLDYVGKHCDVEDVQFFLIHEEFLSVTTADTLPWKPWDKPVAQGYRSASNDLKFDIRRTSSCSHLRLLHSQIPFKLIHPHARHSWQGKSCLQCPKTFILD